MELLGLFYILHHSWFPPGWLSAVHTPPLSHHVEYSLGFLHDRLAAAHVILKYSQHNKPSNDGQDVPVVLVWGLYHAFLRRVKWVSPFFYTLE